MNFDSPLAKLNEDENMRNIYMDDRYEPMKNALDKDGKNSTLLSTVAIGFLPFLAGLFLNYVLVGFNMVPPLWLIGTLFLIGWGFLARIGYKKTNQVWKTVVCMNLVAFLVLILLGIQELYLGYYWRNTIGLWTQLYYLPVLNLCFTTMFWTRTMMPVYCCGFVLMVIASYVGCKIKER